MPSLPPFAVESGPSAATVNLGEPLPGRIGGITCQTLTEATTQCPTGDAADSTRGPPGQGGAMPDYLPIADHGVIGDLHSVALVGTDGAIDWYCTPRFDSPSVFGAILDSDRGGRFRIAPEDDGWSSKQLYLPDTNVLITRFLMPDGVGEVQDFMVPPRSGEAAHRHRMIRRVVAVRGQVRFVVEVAPRFDYARASHELA